MSKIWSINPVQFYKIGWKGMESIIIKINSTNSLYKINKVGWKAR